MTAESDRMFEEELAARTARLPFWRRPRRLRRQIAGTLVATALVAVALFGALNYVAADRLLRAGSFEQLDGVAQSRARSIELGAARLLRNTGAVADDPGVARALDEFTVAVAELEDVELSESALAELEQFYLDEVVAPLNDSGLFERTVTLADVAATTNSQRFLHYHLVVPGTPPPPPDTSYAAALAEYDTFLQSLATSLSAENVLLVASGTQQIVYSSDARIDLGAVLTDGTLAESPLARLVEDDLQRVRAGTAVITDFELYVPNGARPTLFSGATIRSASAQVSGALVIEIPGAAIDAITTADGNWDDVGLGDGESYVVASDLLLQSTSRTWVDDPEGYLERVDDRTRRFVSTLGSPVGVQVVDTAPVRAAFRGETFRGRSTNYLGREVYSASATIDVPGVEWAVVTDVPLASARKPLTDYLWRLGIVAVVVVPLAALVGILLARRLSRPIGPAVEAARAVADGDRDPQLPDLGQDEYGDLGRRLKRMAALLAAQERALDDEFQRKRELMLAVLPAHLVDADGSVTDTGERVDEATVVAVTVRTGNDIDDRLAEHLAAAARTAERLADEHGLERIRTAADRYLFVSGARQDGNGVEPALEFGRRFVAASRELDAEMGNDVAVQVGLSTGSVATGVLERGSLTFGAWGEPVRRALAISALSRADEVLLDESTASGVASRDDIVAVDGVVDLDEQPMSLYSLAIDPATGDAASDRVSAGGDPSDGSPGIPASDGVSSG